MLQKNSNFSLDTSSYYDLNRHIDGYISAYLDGWETSYTLSEESRELIWEFIASKYNDIKIPTDYAARLHSTTFFKFLIDWIQNVVIDRSDEKKFVLLAAHGGTIAGI